MDTLSALEARLQRVNFAVTGQADLKQIEVISASSDTAAARLRAIERHLASLCSRCETAHEVLSLHAKIPDVFHPIRGSLPDSIDSTALAAIILSHAQMYQQLAQQLELCKSRSIPEPASVVPLVNLQPRISKIATKQQEQQNQMAELRARSAKVLETWRSKGVLEMSESWVDWEERLRDIEVLVRRMEADKRREEGFV